MLIYSNSNDNSSNLFGDVAYKSIYNRKNIVNRTQTAKCYTPQQQQQQRTKKLTRANIKFLKNLGLRVKTH